MRASTVGIVLLVFASLLHAGTTATSFTYQGRLRDGALPAQGTHNFEFSLWNAANGGSQVATAVTVNNLPVTNGLFTAELDFGTVAFNGSFRWLEITVNGNTLAPRQQVLRTPYAVQTRGIFVDEFFNTGIGTVSPKQRLHNSGDYYGRGHMWLHAFEGDGQSGTAYVQARDDSNFTNIDLRLRTQSFGDPVEAVHIQSNGNVGIGVIPAGSRLSVVGPPSGSGTNTIHAIVQQGTGAAILAEAYDAFNSNAAGEFYNYGSTSSVQYGVQAEATGSAGRGVLGLASHPTSANPIGVRGEVRSTGGASGVYGLSQASTGIGEGVRGQSNSASGSDFCASGAGIDYDSASSRRWKRNITPIADPLNILAHLRGVYFDWNEDFGNRHDIGMIAEEVGAVLPEIVRYEENGIDARGMDYARLTPLLVEAVKTLHDKHETLRAENEALRERLEKLEALMNTDTSSVASRTQN